MFSKHHIQIINKELESFPKPILIVTVGLPLSGKDSLIKLLALSDFYVLSRDKIIEEQNPDLDYRKAYSSVNSKMIDKLFFQKMNELNLSGMNTIVNATNLTKSKRRKTMLRFAEYCKVCLIMPHIDKESFIARNLKRSSEEGKKISDSLYEEMSQIYERVDEEEGFDLIIDLNKI